MELKNKDNKCLVDKAIYKKTNNNNIDYSKNNKSSIVVMEKNK